MSLLHRANKTYHTLLSMGDQRVEEWPLMKSPVPTLTVFVLYLIFVQRGPKVMEHQKPLNLKYTLVLYNVGLVILSTYMFHEFLMSAVLGSYSFLCQEVDYSNDPLALRIANVCWWYFFSKFIELLDTVFFILRKKNDQVSFLHVYHHSTMMLNWWLGVKYVAGGQVFFMAVLNCFVHMIMYTYYALAAMGPHMQKYLWWKKYLTILQLTQFFAVIIHTGLNMANPECKFPQGFNYAVFIYAITLILLFANFFHKTYKTTKVSKKD